MPPVVGGINHCASVQQLRLIDGTDAMPLVREHATEPVVKLGARHLRRAALLLVTLGGALPAAAAAGGSYDGTAQGVKMRYGITTHDMAYEKARVAELEALAATWTAPDAGPVTLADLPEGDEDWGIEVIDIIEAIVANRNRTFVVNAPNEGAIPNLPHDAIVEVNAAGQRLRHPAGRGRSAARGAGRAPAAICRFPAPGGGGGAFG